MVHLGPQTIHSLPPHVPRTHEVAKSDDRNAEMIIRVCSSSSHLLKRVISVGLMRQVIEESFTLGLEYESAFKF